MTWRRVYRRTLPAELPSRRMSAPTRFLIAAVATASLLLAACGSDGSDSPQAPGNAEPATSSEPATTATAAEATTTTLPETTLPPRPPSDYAGFVAQPTACDGAAPAQIAPMVFSAPEDQGLDPAVPVQAVITTSCGEIAVELDPGLAPETVNSFVFLARAGYFDGTVSHRILPGFVLQAGDPTATGREGPGYTIPAEFVDSLIHVKGALAAARTGDSVNPDRRSSGSQFYIVQGQNLSEEQLEKITSRTGKTYSPNQIKKYIEVGGTPLLDTQYTVFGQVVDGVEIIDSIASSKTNSADRPLNDVMIKKITVIK